MKGLRIPVILIIAFISLALFTGGQWAYQEFSVQRPFIEKIANINNVASVTFNDELKPAKLEIKLDSTGGINKTMDKVKEIITTNYSGQVEVEILDQRDEQLSKLLETSQFYIFEALANGNYPQMYANIEMLVAKYGIDKWKLSMDKQYIYLELYNGDNYLYEIIPYGQQSLVLGGDEADVSN